MSGQDPSYGAALARWLDLRDHIKADWIDGLGWRVNGLLVPRDLVDLLVKGRWASASENDVFNSPWGGIYTYSHQAMRSETSHVCYGIRWVASPDPAHAPGDIEPRLTVLIADEGIGSDSPFALDYRASFGQPRVLVYRWRLASPNEDGNRWVEAARDFPTFWNRLSRSPA
jgi:hypothetical protein